MPWESCARSFAIESGDRLLNDELTQRLMIVVGASAPISRANSERRLDAG
jgi:hypothetical protein